jgi:nuclear pore complex protein Nup155
VVADHSRDCFYTLTARNNISVYKTNGDRAIQHIQTLSGLFKQAQEKAPGAPSLTPQNFHIIGLHVVDSSESRSGIQLLAVTSNGARLYFAPSSYSFSYSYSAAGSGTSAGHRPLQLIHVRLPPPNLLHPDEHAAAYRPPVLAYGAAPPVLQPPSRPYTVSALEHSCYLEGLTIAAQPGDTDGTDFILCMSPDLTRIGSLGQLPGREMQSRNIQQPQYTTATYPGTTTRPPLTEHAAVLAIPGRTWAMKPVPSWRSVTASASPQPAVMNELASQFGQPTKQFMILTNVGLTFLAKRRALDYLRAVIEEVQLEGNVQPIIEFRDRHVISNPGAVTAHVPMLFSVSEGTKLVQCFLGLQVGTHS